MRTIKSTCMTLLLLTMILTLCGLYQRAQAQNAGNAEASEIILILDASGSMWGQIDGESKISIAKNVLTGLVSELPDDSRVGLIAYGHRDKGDCNDIETIVEPGPIDKASINASIEALNPKGKTPITDSVLKAFELVKATEDSATVILVSDGLETCGGDPCKAVSEAKAAGVNFIMHVVGFDVGDVDVSELECAAQAGGGLYMSARNADELSQALETAVDIPVTLPIGTLSVKVTAEGKLQDSQIIVTNISTGEELKPQRTYAKPETNPRMISLPDGMYKVEVKPLGMKGVKSRVISDIEILEGEQILQDVDFSFGELSVKSVRNGKLTDTLVTVTDVESGQEIARGRTYTKEQNNPRVFKLAPGVYDVSVKSMEIKNSPDRTFESLEITGGETVEKEVDFSSGTLKIGALKGKKFVDALVTVKDGESGQEIARGRTYVNSDTNPKVFELVPGEYDVEVTALGIKSKPVITYDNVEIKASEIVEETARFTSGVLKIGALDGKKFEDAIVTISDSGTGEQVMRGRIRKDSKSNPLEFELEPGVYDIKVQALDILTKPVKEFKSVEVTGDETFEEEVQFPSGIIKVTAISEEELVDATVTIEDAVTGEELVRRGIRPESKSSPNPIELRMPPGSYKVIAVGTGLNHNPEVTMSVELPAGGNVDLQADYPLK